MSRGLFRLLVRLLFVLLMLFFGVLFLTLFLIFLALISHHVPLFPYPRSSCGDSIATSQVQVLAAFMNTRIKPTIATTGCRPQA